MFIGNWEAIMVAPTSYTKVFLPKTIMLSSMYSYRTVDMCLYSFAVLRSWDSVILEDKWYAYREEEDKLVERDISFLRYETNCELIFVSFYLVKRSKSNGQFKLKC